MSGTLIENTVFSLAVSHSITTRQSRRARRNQRAWGLVDGWLFDEGQPAFRARAERSNVVAILPGGDMKD